MKKTLVCTLILTVIFPANCFTSPRKVFPTEEKILEEILLIIEDGIAEQEEISFFLEKVNVDGIITADDECGRFYLTISLILIGLSQLDFSGSPLEILLDLILLGVGSYSVYVLIILAYELCWI